MANLTNADTVLIGDVLTLEGTNLDDIITISSTFVTGGATSGLIDGGTPEVAGAFASGLVKATLTGDFGADPFGLAGLSTFNDAVPMDISLVQVVPLPMTLPLLLSALGLLFGITYRRRAAG